MVWYILAMRYEELLARGTHFRRYLRSILPLLGRRERGRHAEVYIRDLLVEGGRKTPAAIAQRWPDGNVQALQQLTGQSPWDSWRVRRAVCELILQELTDLRPVWIVDDTAFPKKGDHSVGVARQYCNTLGKVANCQVAVSLHLATTQVSFPVDFALYLPRSWTEDPAAPRVRKACLPREATFKTKWQLALELIDRARSWNLPPGPVVADAVYGRVVDFRQGLVARRLHYVLGIDKDTPVAPLGSTAPAEDGFEVYPGDCKTVSQLAREQPATAWRKVTWRTGTKGALESRFWAARLEAPEGEVWLLAEWPPEAEEPENFWLSNLPAETSLDRLVYYAKSRWWVEQNYRQLKNELGLDHYEGRTWQGWHHHVTLVMVAFGFLVLEFLRAQKNFFVDDTEPEAPPSGLPHLMVRILPDMSPNDSRPDMSGTYLT